MTIKSKKNKKSYLMRSKKVKRYHVQKGGNQIHPKYFYDKSYYNIIKRYNEVQDEIKRINGLINKSKIGDLDELVMNKKVLEKNLLIIKMENAEVNWYIDYCTEYFQEKMKKDLDDKRIQNKSEKDIKDLIETNKEIIFKLISKPISEKVQIEQFKKYDNSENSHNVSTRSSVSDTDILQVKLQNQKKTQEYVFTIRGNTTIAKLKILLAEELQIPPYKIDFKYEANIVFDYYTIANIQYDENRYIEYEISNWNQPREVSSEKPDITYEYVTASELIYRFDNQMEAEDKVKFTRFLREINLTSLFTKIKKGIHTEDEYKEFLKIMHINNFVTNVNIDNSLSLKDISIPAFNNVKPKELPPFKLHLLTEFNDMTKQVFQLNSKLYSLNKNPIKNKDEIEQLRFVMQALLSDFKKFILTNEDIYNYVKNLKKYIIINKNQPSQDLTKSPKFSMMTMSKFFTTYYYTTENEKIWRYITADEIRERLKSLSHKDLAVFLQNVSIMDFNAYLIINKITSNTESLEDMYNLYNILIQQISFKIIEISHGGDEMDFIPLFMIT
jgi:hypothetical protein